MKLIPKGKRGLSFNQAFALARKAGLKTFKWRGGVYGTQLRDEVKTPLMITMGSVLMPGLIPVKNIETIPVSPMLMITGTRKEKNTQGYTDEYGHKFTPHQAQQVVDMSGHKGYALVEDDNGNPVSRIGEAIQGNHLEPGFYELGKAPVVGSGLNEVIVNAHRTHIKPNTEGFIPIYGAQGVAENPVYQNVETGEYFVADKRTGEIFANSPDARVLKDGNLWLNYHTGRNGDPNQALDSFDNTRGARIAAYDRLARNNLQHKIWQNNVDRTQLHNITQAQERGALYINMPGTIASHAIFGYGLPGYQEGFGFKKGSDGKLDWYGPNANTVTGFGSRVVKMADTADAIAEGLTGNKVFDINKNSALTQALSATGDVAGNAVLAELMTNTPNKNITNREVKSYNLRGKGSIEPGTKLYNGRFVGTTSGNPTLTGQITNLNRGYVAVPTRNGNFLIGRNSNGTYTVRTQLPGLGAPYSKVSVEPVFHNVNYTIPGASGTPVGYAPRDNFSGILPMPKYLESDEPITIEYEAGSPNAYIDWKLKHGLDWRNPYGGGNTQDISPESGVKVNYSSGDVNQMRSKGRSGNRNKKPLKSRLKQGNTDTSNK